MLIEEGMGRNGELVLLTDELITKGVLPFTELWVNLDLAREIPPLSLKLLKPLLTSRPQVVVAHAILPGLLLTMQVPQDKHPDFSA